MTFQPFFMHIQYKIRQKCPTLGTSCSTLQVGCLFASLIDHSYFWVYKVGRYAKLISIIPVYYIPYPTGKWSPEEENLLASSVYDLSNASPGESITTGISWAQVAERVGTRTEKQCRAKWLNYLNWKEQGGAEWSKEDDNKLIDR